MKKLYLYLIIFLLTTFGSFAQSFRVLAFEEDMSDLSAVSLERKDVNDQKCAIVKVFTNLNGLFFETRLGIEGDIVKKTGEYWIYISPREKMLKVIKSGYIPLEYAIPANVEGGKVYKMTLTDSNISSSTIKETAIAEFVVIETKPNGAQVYINNQLKGVSPLTVPLLEGEYNCRIEMALYKTEDFNFTLEAGNTFKINKILSELDIYGKIKIHTNLEGEIYIDNEKISSGSYEGRLIEGLHIIKIQADNHKSYTKEILVIANKEYTIEQTLERKLSVISVQSEPLGASIFIDDEFVGTTPKFVRDVFVGEREISIEKQGYATHKEQITVEYDKTKEFVFRLKAAKQFSINTKPQGADVYVNNILIGQSPIEFELDYTKHNKIKISKNGYHNVYDEFPSGTQLNSKSYTLETAILANRSNVNTSINTKSSWKNRRNTSTDRTVFGWSLSGLNARPGGMQTSFYINLGNASQYAVFIDGGYQFNNYDNSYINGVINFPRFSIGLGYNLWFGSFAVLEGFVTYGREYAMGLNWKIYDLWDYPPDMVYTYHTKVGLRAAVRISPHAELFGAYNVNLTDGPAYDTFDEQAVINGASYNYQTIFPDRDSENWEIGIRFVFY
ncbi:MAG: PEGA domain-containing protein [Bacteroidales bacterium]|nr:PEGA domain-containing protein [Bacteroidales bacterium]